MVGLNHRDTIFAPVFAALHEKSKFLYLSREPDDLFKSFYGKQQFTGGPQLMPVHYAFDPEFRWAVDLRDLVSMIAWYIKFTQEFCRAMGRVMKDRFLEIRAEDLFRQDRETIERMLDFIGCSIPLERAVQHYGRKINEKAHKAVIPVAPEVMDNFRNIYRHS